jgi:hypothetical protein
MAEKILVFANCKEDGKFQKYSLVEKPKIEVEKLVEDFNNKPDNTSIYRVIDDIDVLAAIIQKESDGTIKSYCKDVEDSFADISQQIDFLESALSSFMHKIKDELKEDEGKVAE